MRGEKREQIVVEVERDDWYRKRNTDTDTQQESSPSTLHFPSKRAHRIITPLSSR